MEVHFALEGALRGELVFCVEEKVFKFIFFYLRLFLHLQEHECY